MALEIDVMNGDSLLASTVLETVSEPAGIVLEPDTEMLVAGGDDLVFVNIRIVDRMGNVVPHAAVPIQIRPVILRSRSPAISCLKQRVPSAYAYRKTQNFCNVKLNPIDTKSSMHNRLRR